MSLPVVERRDHSRLKIMAKLDISESGCAARWPHHAEDEHWRMQKAARFPRQHLPTLWGENRAPLLDKENWWLDMTKLGFEPESLVKFEKAILKPYGMVLVMRSHGI
jgi:type IV pilus assembly protein PilB